MIDINKLRRLEELKKLKELEMPAVPPENSMKEISANHKTRSKRHDKNKKIRRKITKSSRRKNRL